MCTKIQLLMNEGYTPNSYIWTFKCPWPSPVSTMLKCITKSLLIHILVLLYTCEISSKYRCTYKYTNFQARITFPCVYSGQGYATMHSTLVGDSSGNLRRFVLQSTDTCVRWPLAAAYRVWDLSQEHLCLQPGLKTETFQTELLPPKPRPQWGKRLRSHLLLECDWITTDEQRQGENGPSDSCNTSLPRSLGGLF